MVQPHHFLLACLAVLANLVCLLPALLLDQGVLVVLQILVVHYLEVQEDLEVPLAQVVQLGLALLGEFPQHH